MAITVLYAVGMHEAAASGDLEQMKSLRDQAERHLQEYGNVSAALEVLKAEIAKLEGRGRK